MKNHAFLGVSRHTLVPLVQQHLPHQYWMYKREQLFVEMNVFYRIAGKFGGLAPTSVKKNIGRFKFGGRLTLL